MVRISCPHCHAWLETHVEVVGKSVKCGQCRKVFPATDAAVLDHDATPGDSRVFPSSVRLLMLIAGHVVGLLFLTMMLGLARSISIAVLIVGGEIALWKRTQIGDWLQQIWKELITHRLERRNWHATNESLDGLEVTACFVNHSHPEYAVQRCAVDWARRALRKKHKYVILDTETTGLGTRDEIIQLAVIDLDGNVLFNENIKPTRRRTIEPGAASVHGITMSMLSGCPTFSHFTTALKKAIGKRNVITYNATFDQKMYAQSFNAAGGGFLPQGQWECAMLNYAEFVGEWNEYYGNYKWHKLQGGDHSALGDCQATLRLIRGMAAATKLKRWYEFWIGR